MNLIEQIEKKLQSGIYYLKSKRYSHGIGVSVSNKTNNCNVIVDDIYDNCDNLLYRVERHLGIGDDKEYFDKSVFDYKVNYWVE